MKRMIGYLAAFAGLVIIGLGVFGSGLSFLEGVSEIILYGVGGVLLVVGVLLTFMDKGSSSEKSPEEVPIYQGKKIVGYRRSE